MAEFISIKELNKQFQLKPSFKVKIDNPEILDQFSAQLREVYSQKVEIKRLDEHLWLSIPVADRHYYSPRLHIEIEQKEKGSILHCTFGPDPDLWTMFMFVHFFLGLSFIGLLVWFYANITLDQSNTIVFMFLVALAKLIS